MQSNVSPCRPSGHPAQAAKTNKNNKCMSTFYSLPQRTKTEIKMSHQKKRWSLFCFKNAFFKRKLSLNTQSDSDDLDA